MFDWKKRESLHSKFLTRKHTYHQDILSFCSFVYNNYLFLCSSVENSAFREIYGISTGYVREMFEQHIPLLKPFTHRCFTHFTGNVAQFCEIHDKYVEPHKFFSIHLELSKQFYIFANDIFVMGVTYDNSEKKFVFDFEHDGTEDIVSLTGNGYQVEAFGKCFYYGYEFSEQVDGPVRSAFIKYVKFTEELQDTPDLTNFIKKAVDNLGKQINLYDYDLVVMPQSLSKVNQYMLRYIYRFAQPTLRKMELIKALPASISFDMDAYEQSYLNDVLENGRPRYTPAQKEEAKKSINAMLDLIHQKDYFTIAKDVKKSRFRPYMMNFLRFASDEDAELCSKIRHQNVLVIDDVTTSGSTLNEILRTLRILNEDNEITIFSLIGRKDLMAESL